MKIINQIDELKGEIKKWKKEDKTFGVVLTMGALHDGHLRLVEVAKYECNKVVVTIFVNPTQFAPHEDFDMYPRTFDSDCEKLKTRQTDILFVPSSNIIYPNGPACTTEIIPPKLLSQILCGQSRPLFFNGVSQVCCIFFNIIKPDYAYFGEKDRQQLVIVKKMVHDLHLDVNIVGVPTVRDKNGLALSSRNAYLNQQEQILASELYRTMNKFAFIIRSGDKDFDNLCNQAKVSLISLGFKVDYFELRNPVDLSENLSDGKCIFAAVWLNETRLIDNLIV